MDTRKVGHEFGNFHQYYDFHSSQERLNLIPENFFQALWIELDKPKAFVLLDVGCNDGTLTFQLYERACKELQNVECMCYVLGIDIDETLIQQANVRYSSDSNIKFLPGNIASDNMSSVLNNYLHSVGNSAFNLVTLFSITMWIHLHHGDHGLKRILELSSQLTNSSVLIEPQPWKCYKTAIKRVRKLDLPDFPYPPNQLTIKNIEKEIETLMIGSYAMTSKYVLGKEIWGRSLMLFCKRNFNSLQQIPVDINETHVDAIDDIIPAVVSKEENELLKKRKII